MFELRTAATSEDFLLTLNQIISASSSSFEIASSYYVGITRMSWNFKTQEIFGEWIPQNESKD